MGIQGAGILAGVRAPLFYAQINAGGTPRQNKSRIVYVGQMLNSGLATELEPLLVGDSQFDPMFGRGSMLAAMGKIGRKNYPLAEIWFVPVKDDVAGVAATGTLTVAGAPVANPGTLAVYIAGQRIRIAVKTSQNDAALATALVDAINKNSTLPVTAAAVGAVITLTARHKGALGNTILVDLGYLPEEGPLGAQLLTIADMAGGSGDPDILDALASFGADEFDWIGMPYTDTTNLDRMRDFLSDQSGRWGPMSQLYGHCTTVKPANYSGLQTLGAGRNDQHMTICNGYKIRTPVWEMVAAITAQQCAHLSNPPELSRPLQTIALLGVKGPLNSSDKPDRQERDTLYYDGIANYDVRRDGTVYIDRLITTYQTNAWGDPDATWLDVNTLAQVMYGIRFIRQAITNAHGRQALADDSPIVPDGVATPKSIRDTIIHAYTALAMDGIFENVDAFVEALIVERDGNDASRINVDMRLDHVNQLRILAVAATSYLQANRVTGELAA